MIILNLTPFLIYDLFYLKKIKEINTPFLQFILDNLFANIIAFIAFYLITQYFLYKQLLKKIYNGKIESPYVRE